MTERRFYILLTAALCFPVWLVTWFPSQDGAAHLYNARVIFDLIKNPDSIYQEWYVPTPGMTTNLTAHALLAAMLPLISPPVAEKMLVTLCIVLMAAGVRSAIVSVQPKAMFLSYLALPAATGFFLHMGFYNFMLGTALFCFTLGYWMKRFGTFGGKELATFSVLLVALYVTHIVPYAAALLVIAFPCAWVAFTRRAVLHYAMPTCLAALPSLLLMSVYLKRSAVFTGGAVFPTRSAQDLLIDNPIVSYSSVEGWVLLGLIFVIAILAVYVFAGKLSPPRLTPFDLLAPASLLLFLLFLAAPMKAFGGAYLRGRFWLLGGLTLLFWMASHIYKRKDRVLVGAVGATLTLVMLWSQWTSYALIEDYLREYMTARRVIPPGRSVLNLRYSGVEPKVDGKPIALRIETFLHAGAWLAQAPGSIWINNYEAASGQFPISYRAGLDTNVIGAYEAEPPCVDLLTWQARTGRRIDYVVLSGYASNNSPTGCAPATLHQLERGYELIYTSRRKLVQVYKLRGLAQKSRMSLPGP